VTFYILRIIRLNINNKNNSKNIHHHYSLVKISWVEVSKKVKVKIKFNKILKLLNHILIIIISQALIIIKITTISINNYIVNSILKKIISQIKIIFMMKIHIWIYIKN
jgi:hypothetical protein